LNQEIYHGQIVQKMQKNEKVSEEKGAKGPIKKDMNRIELKTSSGQVDKSGDKKKKCC
jgi:hypothetical protein